MALPNIAKLIMDRERRNLMQFSPGRAMHGVIGNGLRIIPSNAQTGMETEGFIFGRDVWGIGVFSEETSSIGQKYGL